jgi:hypothetical protein
MMMGKEQDPPTQLKTYLRVQRMKLHMYPTMHHW